MRFFPTVLTLMEQQRADPTELCNASRNKGFEQNFMRASKKTTADVFSPQNNMLTGTDVQIFCLEILWDLTLTCKWGEIHSQTHSVTDKSHIVLHTPPPPTPTHSLLSSYSWVCLLCLTLTTSSSSSHLKNWVSLALLLHINMLADGLLFPAWW